MNGWAGAVVQKPLKDQKCYGKEKINGFLKMSLLSPTSSTSPTSLPDKKNWNSGITFGWVVRFGWNFAMRLLDRIYNIGIEKSCVEHIFMEPPDQPKMTLVEIFWKFRKFRFFSMKHPQTNAFKHNLGKNHFLIDSIATLCLILYCFVYGISPIKLNLHEKWAQLREYIYGFVNVTSSAIQ